jgi:hypothetical protein
MSESASSSGGGGCGCASFIIGIIVVWAFLFGVTYGGKHYGVQLSCDHGVVVE